MNQEIQLKLWQFILICTAFTFFGSSIGNEIRVRLWEPILIEHGAAYYTHDTGEFVIIRKGEEGE